METHKQTWWDKEIKSQFNEFQSWVGSSQADSKKIMRKFIAEQGFKSVVDIGCGICDDYFVYKNEYPDILWIGVEPSKFLHNLAIEKDIPVKNEEGHYTSLSYSGVNVAYSRHVLEHQEDFKPILNEMIRIAEHMVIHTFFIKPRNEKIINYNEKNNLYHNTYSKPEIEEFLKEHNKVKDFTWKPLTGPEEALIIKL